MKRSTRGVAMVIVLFMVFICSVLGFTAISIATLDSQATTQQLIALEALNLARSGIYRASAELRNNYYWGTTQSYAYTLYEGSYTVSVWASPNNVGSVEKLWKVTSTASQRGATRSVSAWLRLESFAKFAYFTNSELSTSGGTIWFSSRDTITGATGTNGFFSIQNTPQFTGKVSSANTNDSNWNSSSLTYTQGGTAYTDPTKFYHYNSSYAVDYPTPYMLSPTFSFAGGQPVIAFPSGSATVKSGATVLLSGNATLIFNSNGTVTIQQSGVSDRSVSTALTTIYVDQGTASVSGTVNGRVTVGALNGISITGNLFYNNRASDVLGLISDGIIAVNTNASTVADLEIDASIMSVGNDFEVSNFNTGIARGTLHIFGGIIQKYRGPVATGNVSTGAIATGYAKDYQYDAKLIDKPPPNFLTTGNITVLSYTDMGALGH